jgi:hypothetical protein
MFFLGSFQNFGRKTIGGQIGGGRAETGGWKINYALFDK